MRGAADGGAECQPRGCWWGSVREPSYPVVPGTLVSCIWRLRTLVVCTCLPQQPPGTGGLT